MKTNFHLLSLCFWVGIGVTLLVGALLRLYRLDGQELWLDELYMAQLVQDGLDVIWRTAFVDVLPPLSTLPYWLAGQIGGVSAVSLRLVSVVTSLIALLAFYRYCMIVLDRSVALMAVALFAIAPLAVYYAQEARPYALALMGAVLTMLAYERLRQRGSVADWALYVVLAIIAGQFHYFNVVLVGAQLLALLILARDRRRTLLGGALTVLAVTATLGPFVVGAARVLSHWRWVSAKLDFLSTMQTMMAGDARFASAVVRTVALAIAAVGLALALTNRRCRQALLLHVFQIAMPILVSFVLLPLLDRPAPSYDERPFLMVLPSVLISFGIGIQSLLTWRVGRLLAVVLIATLCITSCQSLSNYFGGFIKSPEGKLVKVIGPRTHPGDCALTHSNAYSVDAALQFYQPDLPVYRYSRQDAGHWLFVPHPSILLARRGSEEVELDALACGRRFWLATRGTEPPPYLEWLLSQYQVREEYTVTPFRALLLERQ